MKIKAIFTDGEKITIESYCKKQGIKDIKEYLNPTNKYIENPRLYDNAELSAKIIRRAIDNNLYIGILVDIDMDGYSSASVIYKTIKHLNPRCKIKIFLQKFKTHGLNNDEIMKDILDSGIKLLITPDSSSGDFEQHKILRENKIMCCCIDHHPCSEYSSYAIVVNNQLSDKVLNKDGSGCLVTFKVCQLLDKQFASSLLDIVWFSLISDIMDMTSMENRTITNYAKDRIYNKFLKAMIQKYIIDVGEILCNESISWRVQPKISAIIRCNDDSIKQKLFMAIATERQEYIDFILENCDDIHARQNKIVGDYFKGMTDIDESNRVIFEPTDIYSYYGGILASRIVNKYNRPTILYRKSKHGYTGSVRSDTPIKQTLLDSELFTFASGHSCALGVGFSDGKIEQIKDFMKTVEIDDSDKVTCSLDIKSITIDLCGFNEKYKELFGQGLKPTKFHIQSFTINSSSIKLLGKDKRTVKITYVGVDFMLFRISNIDKERLHIGESIDLKFECIGELGLNFYMGRTKKQVLVDKFEAEVVEEEDIWKIFD